MAVQHQVGTYNPFAPLAALMEKPKPKATPKSKEMEKWKRLGDRRRQAHVKPKATPKATPKAKPKGRRKKSPHFDLRAKCRRCGGLYPILGKTPLAAKLWRKMYHQRADVWWITPYQCPVCRYDILISGRITYHAPSTDHTLLVHNIVNYVDLSLFLEGDVLERFNEGTIVTEQLKVPDA